MNGRNVVRYALFAILGAIVGAFATGNIVLLASGCITLLGLGTAFLLNWVYIAPEAGRRAKENLMRSFAEPTEDDLALIQGATYHIIGNAKLMAEDPEMRELFKPQVDLFLDILDERWQTTLANRKSQYAKGVGQFAGAEGTDIEAAMQEFKETAMHWGDEMLDSMGFEQGSGGRKLGQMMIMKGLAGIGAPRRALSDSTTPDYIRQ